MKTGLNRKSRFVVLTHPARSSMSSTGAATPMSCRANRNGSAFVYLEAMNYAKTCVECFDDGGAEVLVDGVAGFLVRDPNDPPKVLQLLCTLLVVLEGARRL